MPLARWVVFVALAVGISMLITAQRMAVFMEGYLVGKRLQQVQEYETRLSWLSHQVIGEASPASLAREAQSRQLALVAWSSIDELSTADDPRQIEMRDGAAHE
ncbi:MAG: hypothetical protein HY737_00365 [Candidatus Omnitrophica bacterium]|nr:hypothetical protein [Candidatus Omnitrophota bacterium]